MYLIATPRRFPLGRVLITPGAQAALLACSISPWMLLQRHQAGDWGDLDPEDCQANARALREGSRLLSAYPLTATTRIWVITDRSVTTLLLPEEY